MNSLFTGKTFLLGLVAGVVVGAVAYKYVAIDKKISTTDLSNSILDLAKKVGGKAGGRGQGQGRFMN